MIDESWLHGWNEAKKYVRNHGGLSRFKSVLFKQMFKNKPYPCEFLILHDGPTLMSMMTYCFKASVPEYGLTDIWFIGDFDTAKGTHGMASEMLYRFIRSKGDRFYLGCWDDVSLSFWNHMADKFNLTVSRIGTTYFNTPILQFGPRA